MWFDVRVAFDSWGSDEARTSASREEQKKRGLRPLRAKAAFLINHYALITCLRGHGAITAAAKALYFADQRAIPQERRRKWAAQMLPPIAAPGNSK